MKQNIFTALAIIFGIAFLIPTFLFIQNTIQDHDKLEQVITFLNDQLTSVQKAQQTTGTPATVTK